FEIRTEYDETTVQRESTDRRSHGVRARRRRQNDFGTAEPLESFRDIAGLAVDVIMSAELPSQRFLIFPASDRDRAEAHLRRELHTEMSKPANPEDRDGFSRAGAAVA